MIPDMSKMWRLTDVTPELVAALTEPDLKARRRAVYLFFKEGEIQPVVTFGDRWSSTDPREANAFMATGQYGVTNAPSPAAK